jgi:uncharacterized protein YndB with AHSA1/START domain
MTTQGTVSVTIAARPEAVWPWVADLGKHAEWSPKPYRVELVSGEMNAVGSRYRSVGWVPPNDGNHANDVEITQVEPTSRFALEATDDSGVFRNTFDLVTVDAGTEVTFHLVFPEMRGMSAILVPILFPLVGKSDMRKRMGLLKAKVESAG